MAELHAHRSDITQVGGFLVHHARNDKCTDYNLPDGMIEGWRVLSYQFTPEIKDFAWVGVHVATSHEEAVTWINAQA